MHRGGGRKQISCRISRVPRLLIQAAPFCQGQWLAKLSVATKAESVAGKDMGQHIEKQHICIHRNVHSTPTMSYLQETSAL